MNPAIAVIDRPAMETHDELVPSRYALKVGDLEVLVVSDGTLLLPPETLAVNATPAELSTWLEYLSLPQDKFGWPVNVLVVRSGEQVILVDAGLGGQFPDFPRAGKLPQRLEAAGIELSSITDIVITHMHMDHVGGLLVDGIKERLNPNVRIHASAIEASFWRQPDFSQTAMPAPVPPVLRSTATAFLDRYGDKLKVFSGDRFEIAPGVVARLTGGHTPGHCVVELSSRGERLMFVGDAVFQVAFDHPHWHNGFEHEPMEATRVRIDLFRELANNGALMVGTHLPFPSVGRVAIDGEIFRWVPAVWDY